MRIYVLLELVHNYNLIQDFNAMYNLYVLNNVAAYKNNTQIKTGFIGRK